MVAVISLFLRISYNFYIIGFILFDVFSNLERYKEEFN